MICLHFFNVEWIAHVKAPTSTPTPTPTSPSTPTHSHFCSNSHTYSYSLYYHSQVNMFYCSKCNQNLRMRMQIFWKYGTVCYLQEKTCFVSSAKHYRMCQIQHTLIVEKCQVALFVSNDCICDVSCKFKVDLNLVSSILKLFQCTVQCPTTTTT